MRPSPADDRERDGRPGCAVDDPLLARPASTDHACLQEMPGRAASSPQPPDLRSELERGEIGLFGHGGYYTEIELSGVVLSDQRANGVTFDTTRLVNVEISGSQLDDLRLTDSTLTGVTAST